MNLEEKMKLAAATLKDYHDGEPTKTSDLKSTLKSLEAMREFAIGMNHGMVSQWLIREIVSVRSILDSREMRY